MNIKRELHEIKKHVGIKTDFNIARFYEYLYKYPIKSTFPAVKPYKRGIK